MSPFNSIVISQIEINKDIIYAYALIRKPVCDYYSVIDKIERMDFDDNIKKYHSGILKNNDELLKKIRDFCVENQRGPNRSNYGDEHQKYSLIDLILTSDRFNEENGALFVLTSEEKIIAISGVTRSPLSPEIAHGGCRTLVDRNHGQRFLITNSILPLQIAWAKEMGFREFNLSFNVSNEKFFKLVKRLIHGRAGLLGAGTNRFYRSFQIHKNPLWIYSTRQYLIFKKIDQNFTFEYAKFEMKTGHEV